MSSQRVKAPQAATIPPTTQSQSISSLLLSPATVNPEVVRTPTPTMLATIMKVAVATPNSAGITEGLAFACVDSDMGAILGATFTCR